MAIRLCDHAQSSSSDVGKQDALVDKNVQQMFLKYTAQQIKFTIVDNDSSELTKYVSTQQDIAYQFWERRPYKATMYNRKGASQKIDYTHYNPVKFGGLQVFVSQVLSVEC